MSPNAAAQPKRRNVAVQQLEDVLDEVSSAASPRTPTARDASYDGNRQLDLLSPLHKTPLLQRSMLSSTESVDPETGSPAKSLSTKTVILSTGCCLRSLSAALGFPSRYRAARFNGPNVSLFQQDSSCLGPGMKVSYKQICIVLLDLSSESDSVFRLTPACPVVSLVVYSLI